MASPLILVEGGTDDLDRLAEELKGEDWSVRRGWEVPGEAWGVRRLVCVGPVADEGDAAAAVLAAARGAGVVASVGGAPPAVRDQLFDDLSRVGAVEVRAAGAPEIELDDEQRRLLSLLADGRSLDQAAAELGYSRRTVSRRLADARRAFEVETTAETLARWSYLRQKLE